MPLKSWSLKWAATLLEQARQGLIALTQHPNEARAAVTVSRYWLAGAVDYKRVPQLLGVDLEAYRGKAREEVRVNIG